MNLLVRAAPNLVYLIAHRFYEVMNYLYCTQALTDAGNSKLKTRDIRNQVMYIPRVCSIVAQPTTASLTVTTGVAYRQILDVT